MRDWSGKRYWLVGASEGMGRELAKIMSRAGVDLILSARNEEALNALAAELPGRVQVVPTDITDAASVQDAVDQIGEIDGMVFMAGVYWPTKAQEWDPEQVEAMFDVNLVGAARIVGRIIKPMVERNDGHLVLIGSLSAYRGLPGAIGYSASKAGLMALAESMHGDLKNTEVEVQLVNPGFVRTRLTEKNDFDMPFIMDAEPAAQAVFDHMCSGTFQKDFPWGFGLPFRLSRFLPTALYEAIFFRR